jgi:trans-feruloyl-CoA hydratase/vanillin synthase
MTDRQKFETLKIEQNGDGITWLYLNRPEKRNAMNPTLHLEMVEALSDLAFDDETRVLVLTGAGSAFCAGMDIKEFFRDLQDSPREFARIGKASQEWRYQRLSTFPKPTIAMVNGWCCGGAFTPLINCDLAVAADEAQFCLSEVNWGIIPGGLVSKMVTDTVNWRDAMYYSLTGEPFDGKRAVEIHLVNKSVPLAELKAETTKLASLLMEKNPTVYRMTREALRAVRDMDIEQSMDYLAAKSAQLSVVDREHGKAKGMSEFLDTKRYRPGLGAYPKD